MSASSVEVPVPDGDAGFDGIAAFLGTAYLRNAFTNETMVGGAICGILAP